MSEYLRPDLPDMPLKVALLPRHRGYPVPWFVAWIDGEPDFRVLRPGATKMAWENKWCWVCGQKMGRHVAFVIGPMCAINRTSAEPAAHRDCALFSATACPFLSKPHMVRREGGLPEEAVEPAGTMLKRNPGVTLVWITDARYAGPFRTPDGGVLFDIGDSPSETLWFAKGREATREEVLASIESGLPLLVEMAKAEGPRAELALEKQRREAMDLVPT